MDLILPYNFKKKLQLKIAHAKVIVFKQNNNLMICHYEKSTSMNLFLTFLRIKIVKVFQKDRH